MKQTSNESCKITIATREDMGQKGVQLAIRLAEGIGLKIVDWGGKHVKREDGEEEHYIYIEVKGRLNNMIYLENVLTALENWSDMLLWYSSRRKFY